jgi:hypothetical protein
VGLEGEERRGQRGQAGLGGGERPTRSVLLATCCFLLAVWSLGLVHYWAALVVSR